MSEAETDDSDAPREAPHVQDKEDVRRYLTSAFDRLKDEVAVDLAAKFVKLDSFITLTNEQSGGGGRLEFPRDFKRALNSARHACVQLETMAASHLEMLGYLLHPEECEEFTEEFIQDLLNGVKIETLKCTRTMKSVLRKFEDVRVAFQKFIDALRSDSDIGTSIPPWMLQKFFDIIPWSFIPRFVAVRLHGTPSREHASPEPTALSRRITTRSLKECLQFAERLVEPLNGVIDVWSALFRQVMLVSWLLKNSRDFFNIDTNPEEVNELYDFFACLEAAARDFIAYPLRWYLGNSKTSKKPSRTNCRGRIEPHVCARG
eukprot:GEMP01054400.1.p1 GENE.GEMP01054400.1~~GEMP01054400.1.p1  ORF type:complete len:318 (+),score=48.81 GEMP01054400.1:40-993(+)